MDNEADNFDSSIKDAEKLLNETKEVKEEIKEVKEVVEEIKEEKPVPPVESSEKDDEHGEKSRLGRKVKRLESTLDDISQKLDKALTKPPVVPDIDEPEPELDEFPTREQVIAHDKWAKGQLLKEIKRDENERTKVQTESNEKYARDYVGLLKKTVDEEDDPELFSLLTNEQDNTYNRVYSHDAKEDFLINYRNAVDFLRKKPSSEKQFTKGKVPPNAPNVPTLPSEVIKTVDTSKWSPEERELSKLFDDKELSSLGL